MRILLLFLSLMLVAASAQADLCDPAWIRTANGPAAQALIRGGADVNQICIVNRNRPLHQTILTPDSSPDLLRALLDAGADPALENLYGESAMYYAQGRWDRATARLSPGSGAYRREQAIYRAFFGALESRGDAVADAHDKLCDLNWWRSSASESTVQALLRAPGVDPDYICNFNNDRIIHQPLKLTSFVMLTGNTEEAIEALVDAGADLHARNNTGDSAVSLAGMRYDRVTDRIIGHTIRWCNIQITSQQFADEITRNKYDTGFYFYITAAATKQDYDRVVNRVSMELYRINSGGTIDYWELCRYRGVNVR